MICQDTEKSCFFEKERSAGGKSLVDLDAVARNYVLIGQKPAPAATRLGKRVVAEAEGASEQ